MSVSRSVPGQGFDYGRDEKGMQSIVLTWIPRFNGIVSYSVCMSGRYCIHMAKIRFSFNKQSVTVLLKYEYKLLKSISENNHTTTMI